MNIIMAIDPSGNFEEGKGHTGLAYMFGNWDTVSVASINAKDFKSRVLYWDAILDRIKDLLKRREEGDTIHIVIEKYVTRSNGFTTGKVSETAMLMGLIIYTCETNNIPYTMQSPSQAKTRYSDAALCKLFTHMEIKGNRYYLNTNCTNDHERDALRHLAFYKNYREN